MPDLTSTTDLLRLLADPRRVRLLSLVGREELTVAELTAATQLAQSRVSTHLGKLREAGLLRVRRAGAATYYVLNEAGMPEDARVLWELLRGRTDDALLAEDERRMRALLATRGGSWADSVAGRMERHYSPGRTWEAAARGLVGLASLGDVLDVASGDGALAELVVPRARSVTCLDLSARVVSAGRERLAATPSVRFSAGDMHALPFEDARFDQLLLVNSLSYSHSPKQAVLEAARVLRPGGELVAVALKAHRHGTVAAAYDHKQFGFQPGRLRSMLDGAGLDVSRCEVTSREKRAPHFEIITAYARRRVARTNTRGRRKVAHRRTR
ncbi:MAG: ArsR/SmtB family transcription factor [Planctomycetota bacterium]|jgi:ArsR family transcriptional regulator